MNTSFSFTDEDICICSIYFTAFDGNTPNKIEPLSQDGFGNLGLVKNKLFVK